MTELSVQDKISGPEQGLLPLDGSYAASLLRRQAMSVQSIPPIIVYKDIAGFPGYRVGDDGSVWSLWKPSFGGWKIGTDWKLLRGGVDKDGYRKLILCFLGQRRCARINILVLEAFRGPRPAGMVAAHRNGDKLDNSLENLRWDTQAGNCADKKVHGTHQAGEKHGMHKLVSSQVSEIRRKRLVGQSLPSLAQEFGITKSAVSSICRRRTWKHIA